MVKYNDFSINIPKNYNETPLLETSDTYDLILQNNASKNVYIFKNLNDLGGELFYSFDLSLPSDAADGEYSYFVIKSPLNAVYDTQTNVMDTVIRQGQKALKLKELHPDCGLLKNGGIKNYGIFKNENKEYLYR